MNEIEKLINAINSNIFKNPSFSPKEEYLPTSDFKHGSNQACRMVISHLEAFQSNHEPVCQSYTVAKEPLYYVDFGFCRFLVEGEAKLSDGTRFIWIEEWESIEQNQYEKLAKFTEAEIKAIDERYWAFAVPVEEEAE